MFLPKTMFLTKTIFLPKTMFWPLDEFSAKTLFPSKTMFSPKKMFYQKWCFPKIPVFTQIHVFTKNHTFTKILVFTKNNVFIKSPWFQQQKNNRFNGKVVYQVWPGSCSQIQGTRSKKDADLRDKSVPYFHKESGPCPLDWRLTIHSKVDLVFFQQSWHIWLCWKVGRTTFQCKLVLQSRGRNFILVEIWWSQDLRVDIHNTLLHYKGLPNQGLKNR